MLKHPTSRRSSDDDELDQEQEVLDLHLKHCEQRLAMWRGTATGTTDDTDEVIIRFIIILFILAWSSVNWVHVRLNYDPNLR